MRVLSLTATTHWLLVVFVTNKHDLEQSEGIDVKSRNGHSAQSPACHRRHNVILYLQLGLIVFIAGCIIVIVVIEYIDTRLDSFC